MPSPVPSTGVGAASVVLTLDCTTPGSVRVTFLVPFPSAGAVIVVFPVELDGIGCSRRVALLQRPQDRRQFSPKNSLFL